MSVKLSANLDRVQNVLNVCALFVSGDELSQTRQRNHREDERHNGHDCGDSYDDSHISSINEKCPYVNLNREEKVG